MLLDRFFYIPSHYEYKEERVPFFEAGKAVFIEFCSGNGQWIGERAKQNREICWIAVEKRFERARKIWLLSHRENLPNLMVVCGEALTFTRFYAPHCKEVYVNFPDPWPKLRHAKHRLIQAEFLEALQKIVEKGGTVTCATDDGPYAEQMEREFVKCPDWQSAFRGTEWPEYGRSYFKDLWLQKGKTIHYLSYERR